MTPDATLLSGIVTGVAVLLTVAAGAIRRSRLLGAMERLHQGRTMVRVVREQRRMAAVPLEPGRELTHSLKGGPRLVVRQSAAEQQPEKGGTT